MFFRKPKLEVHPHDHLIHRRTCLVDGDRAYFHGWVEQAVIFKDHRGEGHILKQTYALVEYIDGTVELTQPERLRFTDH